MASNSPASAASAIPAPGSSLHANGHPASAVPAAASPVPVSTPGLVSHPGRPASSSSVNQARSSPVTGFRPPPYHSGTPSPAPTAALNRTADGTPRPTAATQLPSSATPARQGSVPSAQPRQTTPYGQRGVRPADPMLPRHAGIVNPRQAARPAIPKTSTQALEPDDPRGGISIPSPGPDHSIANVKFRDDYFRIYFAIQQSLPESARAAIRENWRKVLLGSVFNQGFILSAMVCNAEPDVIRQTMKDFGSQLTSVAKNELMEHLTAADIDSLTDVILQKASNRFLDAALERRLPTIDAKPLINALARAARLGYEPDDIEDDSPETSTAPSAAAPTAAVPTAPATTNVAPAIKRQCKSCNRLFSGEVPFYYHVDNRICWQRAPPQQGFKFACQECGQGFVDANAILYHQSVRACTTVGLPRQAAAAPLPQPAAPVYSVTSSTPARQNSQPSHHIAATNPAAKTYSSATEAPKTHEHGAVQESEMQTPARHQTPVQTPQSVTEQKTPSAIARRGLSEAYAHLSEEKLEELNAELLGVEQAFAHRFQEAELIDNETERMQRLEGLKNSFGTRQSMVRKKFGVRLRERRTKAEILAEKERMGISVKPHGNTAYVTKRVRTEDFSPYRNESPDMDGTGDRRKRRTPSNAYNPYSGGVLSLDSKYLVPSDSRGPSSSITVIRGSTTASAVPDTTTTTATSAVNPASTPGDDDNMSDSSSDDDDDIPALLPDDVRQSLSNR